MMPKLLRILLFIALLPLFTIAQITPKRELRGAWIATYLGIDWPNRTQTPAQQQAAFITIVNHHKATGLNALYVQVRSQCDALYNSSIDPWSADLTGTQGVAPNPAWDPMQFAIEECHKRGMEFHAWINPYRAVANSNNLPGFAASHVAKQHPEWLLSQGTLRVLDPGLPQVRDYITSVIDDIVRRYDVDGIHFDDYFYPGSPSTFNDDATYAADPRGFTDRGDWRRDNISLLIKRLYDTIKAVKPWVKFGISPSGIYRNSTDPEIGSPTTGLQHYVTLFADTRKWLEEGWVDYIMPQVYWYIGQPGADYAKVMPWWNSHAYGRHIYIGMAGYKVNDAAQAQPWKEPTQIPNQVRMNRDSAYSHIYGQSIYNTSSLRSSTRLGFRDSLRLHFYNRPALQPTMPWRDNAAPEAPIALNAYQHANDSVTLNWVNMASTVDEMDKARQFVIYRSTQPAIDTNVMLAITTQNETSYTDTTIEPNTTYYYAVSAVDRFHNESGTSNLSANLPPEIICPDTTLLINADAACSIQIPDYRQLAQVTDTAGVTFSQWPLPGSVVQGNQLIHLIATNAGGKSDTCGIALLAGDSISPVISNISTDPSIITIANNQMKDVTVHYNVSDCSPLTSVLTVTSNEPISNADWEIVNDHQLKLRAMRSIFGNGRIYTITVTSTDSAGNVSTASTEVIVPGHKPWTSGGGLAVTAVPNPTMHQFALLMISKDPQPISIRVLNNSGQFVESRDNIAPNSTLRIGANYVPGIYYVEILQGTKRQILKLIKIGH
jgi:uncharacterized lipoprotein YddW (UPF0748 family)